MNAFGHAAAASWVSGEPRFVLGAMLPDLALLVDARAAGPTEPGLREGWRHHHATDAAFHALPAFRSRQRSGARALRRAGLRRHAATAAAHVALELLLDGRLAEDPTHASAYAAALAQAASGAEPAWRLAPRRSWPRLIERLAAMGAPGHLGRPGVVAERVVASLGRRRRLALDAREARAVADWLPGLAPEAGVFADEVVEALGAGPQRRQRGSRSSWCAS